jgi:hypothetical protein
MTNEPKLYRLNPEENKKNKEYEENKENKENKENIKYQYMSDFSFLNENINYNNDVYIINDFFTYDSLQYI